MLDLTEPTLALSFLPTPHTVLRLPRSIPLPPSILSLLSLPPTPSTFISFTLTSSEISLILPTALFHSLPTPLTASSPLASETQSEGPWSILKVKGPMQLHLTGILHALVGPLKEEGVAIFASSTYDTDYVLVHEVDRDKAEQALRKAGWVFGA
ncbi:hypothetical protein RQP46_010751 [Phenoliferia psychrophenolica]